MRRMAGRPRAGVRRSPHGRRGRFRGRRSRYAALALAAVTVGAMVVVARNSACASGLPQQSGGALAADTRFYLDPYSAVEYWDTHNTANPLEPAIASRIGNIPSGIWFTQYDPDRIATQVRQITTQAAAENTVPVLVLYDIPDLSCSTSSGAPSVAAYESWASDFASGLGDHPVIVIVEPDAISLESCLNAQQAAARNGAIAYAGSAVRKADPNARVYFDAGNSSWNSASVQAQRLAAANVATSANGIVSNVSNFLPTANEVTYDEQVLADLGSDSSLHIVIDTSRNGNGAGNTWCDPAGRALGETPTVNTGNALVDAYLWVKDPGQSDGCAASAGAFDPDLAYALIANGPGGAPTPAATKSTAPRTTATQATSAATSPSAPAQTTAPANAATTTTTDTAATSSRCA